MVTLLCHHRHHCTIKQTSLAQRQRTGNRPFLLHRNYQTHKQDLCRSKFFPGTLICFATQLPALPRTKKPHSINALYGFYSTCCNLKVSVFQNFCNLVAFACKQKFTCAFRVFAYTSSVAFNTAFARNPCSFWRAATVPQRLLGRVRPHRP